ncbi:hypothetical protein BFJ63_vAg19343, partial [Fusarium oxysporum f. sp. narcissi]
NAASFLHLATLDPNTRRPELVAIMAAAGAALTSDPALIKLGCAIQECVRVTILKLWEDDNTLVRDLQLLQAFCVVLEIGLWSGFERKVEIAEGLLQPMLTMFRRDGKFKRSAYSDIMISNDLEGAALNRTWLAWVDSESYKRLAFRLLLHDSSSSVALLVNPLISYAEFTVPLPLSEDIWSCSSAEHWKALCISRASGQALDIADFLTDPEALLVHRDAIDLRMASFALLSYSWSLCWEYAQLKSLQRRQRDQWNTLAMSSRCGELSRLVDNLRMVFSLRLAKPDTVTMRLELVLLHLHMPFEDIKIFAGLEGPERARSVCPSICEWAASESARRSVYHAAQIIREAREMPQGSMGPITAIMLYHASLAFLAYGLLATPRGVCWEVLSTTGVSTEEVFLDRPENASIRRFLERGRGTPCLGCSMESGPISNMSKRVYLSEPRSVIRAVVDVLRANFHNRPRPWLLDKLVQLMMALEGSLSG